MTFTEPIAPVHPITRTHHDISFIDNYEWLRDKESAETTAYLEAENAYTAQETAHLKTLEDNIFQEIKSRVKETDMSVPTRLGRYWYYGRMEEGKSYGISARVPVIEDWVPPVVSETGSLPDEEILLDANQLAKGHDFFSLGASTVDDTGRYLAYSTDTEGSERFTLYIKDLETGELLDDVIDNVFYGVTWAGTDYLFYTRVDDAWRSDSVWRHKVGTPASEDVRVFHEEDERFNVGVGSSRSKRFLIIESSSKVTSESWVLELDNPTGEFRVIRSREHNVEYSVSHAVLSGKDAWLIVHNAHGPNFELGWMWTTDTLGSFDDLRVLVPHRDTVRIEGVDAYEHQLVIGYRREAISRAGVMKLEQGNLTEFVELEFPEELYTIEVMGNPEWNAPVLRLAYSSYVTPTRIYDYTVATGELRLLKEQEVLGGYNPDDYVANRVWVTASDGVDIPVSLVHRRDVDLSHPNPTILYGYGSYEISLDPGFSVASLSLMDRGMIFAFAHVRGGGELGRHWYDNGKMLHKRNTFTDFIAVADHLLDHNLTTRDTLVALGGSAGGLLMGAVANLGGDRFKAIEANVPFVDPLTSMLMPELPLTVPEWEEWGNPLADKDVYDYMAGYAPYENIEAKTYPNILALTSINDTRVLYVEPAKWIAQLRATATDGKFLLKTEMAAGHGGVSGRYESWRQTAFEYAWLINQATGKVE